VAIISIPKPLREKLGEEGTEALVQVLNQNEKEFKSSVIDFAEQRFEQSLSREIAAVRVDLADAEKRLMTEIADLRGGIAKSKSDTIKWMFIFWIGQIGAVLGIIMAVFK
jgi:hypothetical protein